MRRVPNPREIREGLGLTQREFARNFHIALATLQDWDQGTRRPDSTRRAYLRVIAQILDEEREALGAHDEVALLAVRSISQLTLG